MVLRWEAETLAPALSACFPQTAQLLPVRARGLTAVLRRAAVRPGGHAARRVSVLSHWRMALPAQRDWENPAVYQIGKQRSHVPLRSFSSPETALRYFTHGPAAAERQRQLSLNSLDWRFQLFDRPEAVPGFAEEDFDDSQWPKVGNVPQAARLHGGFFT